MSGVTTVLVARTDALSAELLTADIDYIGDRPFLTGERTSEGFFRVRPGLDQAIARGLAAARPARGSRRPRPRWPTPASSPTRSTPSTPGKLLAYNCSPSFNWKRHLDDDAIARFQRELGETGYAFQFITLAGFHALNESMFELWRTATRERGMPAYVELQEREFGMEAYGYTATRHQREVGTGYFDLVAETISAARRHARAGGVDRVGAVRTGRDVGAGGGPELHRAGPQAVQLLRSGGSHPEADRVVPIAGQSDEPVQIRFSRCAACMYSADLGRVLGVGHLDAVEPGRGQLVDQRRRHRLRLAERPGWASTHAPPASWISATGVQRVQRGLLDVRAAVLLDDLRNQGSFQRRDDTRLDQRLGDVRTDDVAALGDLADPLDVIGYRAPRVGDHALTAAIAVVLEMLELGGQLGVLGR